VLFWGIDASPSAGTPLIKGLRYFEKDDYEKLANAV